VGWDEEDISNLLSPNSLVSATSKRLHPSGKKIKYSAPAFQMPRKYFCNMTACQTLMGSGEGLRVS